VLRFEVASVKPVKWAGGPLPEQSMCVSSRTRFTAASLLRNLIACAYDLPLANNQQTIIGAPAWIDQAFYHIEAKIADEDATGYTFQKGRAMLQRLLEDRFQLVVHREIRTVPSYALVIARPDGRLGPQLRPTAPECEGWLSNRGGTPPPIVAPDMPCGRFGVGRDFIRASAMPMAQLATILSGRVERPVEDRTGLSGHYVVDLRWDADHGGPDAAVSESAFIFTAVREQLGLKLEPTEAPIDVLVVDHIERPTPD
jgi:uncharacterized protein (TIGR03435 family)